MRTMSSKMVLWLGGMSLVLVAVGCGGAPAEPSTGADPAAGQGEPHGEHHGEEHGHGEHGGDHAEHGHKDHPEMTPGMLAFHDVMAPLWHADEKSPTRFDDTCKAMAEMEKLGAAVGEEPAPEGKDDDWKAAGEKLVSTLKDLGGVCEATKKDEFQAKFSAVHDAFHVQMELRGGKKHEKHESK